MKQEVTIKLRLQLCDRNRSFGEIIKSIYQVIKQRDGVDRFEILEEKMGYKTKQVKEAEDDISKRRG